jgi:Tn3 transposase DDE domain
MLSTTRGFHPRSRWESANSRAFGRGVLIYWHVERKAMAIHSQLINCTASEVAAMIEGAMRGAGNNGATSRLWPSSLLNISGRAGIMRTAPAGGDGMGCTPQRRGYRFRRAGSVQRRTDTYGSALDSYAGLATRSGHANDHPGLPRTPGQFRKLDA